jgi:hypothetical protein
MSHPKESAENHAIFMEITNFREKGKKTCPKKMAP